MSWKLNHGNVLGHSNSMWYGGGVQTTSCVVVGERGGGLSVLRLPMSESNSSHDSSRLSVPHAWNRSSENAHIAMTVCLLVDCRLFHSLAAVNYFATLALALPFRDGLINGLPCLVVDVL